MSLTVIPRTATLLFSSNTTLSHTGDTNEVSLTSFTLPGGYMGANGVIFVRALWSVAAAGSSNKTYNIKFGSFYAQASLLTSGYQSMERAIAIVNRNSTSSQVVLPVTGYTAGTGTFTGSVGTGSIDTTAAVLIDFTVQLGLNTQTIRLESVQVYGLR